MAQQAVKAKQAAPEGFDQIPLVRHRLYLTAILSPNTLAVYDALKSLVWREEAYGPDALRKRLKQGFLVAAADYEKLSRLTGVGRSRVREHLLKLEKAGWLVPHRQGPKASMYELGLRKEVHKNWAERPYADDVMAKWFHAASAYAQTSTGKLWRSCTEDEKFACAKHVVQSTLEVPKPETDTKDFKGLEGTKGAESTPKKSPLGTLKKSPLGTTVGLEISANPTEPLEISGQNPAAIHNYYNKQVPHFVQEVSYRNLLLSVKDPLRLCCSSPACEVPPAGSLRSPAGSPSPADESAARLDEVCDPSPKKSSSAAHGLTLPSSARPLPLHAAAAAATTAYAFAFAPASLLGMRVTDSAHIPVSPSSTLERLDGPPCESEAPASTYPLPEAERRP